MNIKKHWLKSLAVAAVVAMASANASAEVLAAIAANGRSSLGPAPLVVGGMTTPAFKHPGGRLVATYTAECFAEVPAAQYGRAEVGAIIVVEDAAGNQFAMMYPNTGILCSSGGTLATFSTTATTNLPPGLYRVSVRGKLSNLRASAWMGPRSLVVSR